MSSILDTEKSTLTVEKFENIDAETKFRIAVKEENETKALLTYYRDRIKALDAERKEWLEKLDQMSFSKEQGYKEAQELQAKREEVADLQRSISEAKLSLQNERQQMLKLKRENDQLRLKELEDRKKIYELMVMNEPGEKENMFYKDLRPDVKKQMKNDLSIHLNKKSSQGSEGKEFVGSQKFGKTGKDVLKAIYLPNEQLDTIKVENENLKREMEEERVANEEYIEILKEQLHLRQEELSQREEADLDKLQELMNKNKLLEKYKSLLSKEYFAFRLEVSERKQRLLLEQDNLKYIYNGLSQKLQNHERKAEVENKVAQEMIERKADEYTLKYRNQIKQKDETLFILRDQYASVQKACLEKLKALEESLTKVADKYQTLDQRRMLENEEFKVQLKDIDKKIKQFERRYFSGQTTKMLGEKSRLRFESQAVADSEIHDHQEGTELDEDEEEYASLNSQEFSLIKHQLAELESKLDKSRKRDFA